jgi:Flp pilus assembly protein TadD
MPPALQVSAGIDMIRGRHADAVRTLERLVTQDPVDAVTTTLLAIAQQAAGNEPRAEEARRRAAELQAQTREPVDVAGSLQRLGLSTLGGREGG